MDYEIYTDGGYSRMNNLGAYAFVILENNEMIACGGDKVEYETNNRCELLAIISAIDRLPDKCKAIIYTDSKYAIDTFSPLFGGYANLDLIGMGRRIAKDKHLDLTFEWVKGHSGNEWNEYCDAKCDEYAGIDLNAEYEQYKKK